MLSPTERKLPDIIELFPGFEDRSYFQNPETGEFWFHATNVCKVLGFSNPTSALALHCDDDEKLMEVVAGRQTWFVSEAGCYGLAMGAKNDVAKEFKRWLKHKVLPKLRSQGFAATQMRNESLADYEARNSFLTSENQRLLGENKRVTQINKECSELDAKLAFIILAVVDGVCEQMSQFDLSLMTSKKFDTLSTKVTEILKKFRS
jgi:prophage antirepressor-like protein